MSDVVRIKPPEKEIRIVWPEEDGAPVVLYALIEREAGRPAVWVEFRIWEEHDPLIAPLDWLRQQLIQDHVRDWPVVESPMAEVLEGTARRCASAPPETTEARSGLAEAAIAEARTAIQREGAPSWAHDLFRALFCSFRAVNIESGNQHQRLEDVEIVAAARLVSDGRKSTADVAGAAERIRRRAHLLPKGV